MNKHIQIFDQLYGSLHLVDGLYGSYSIMLTTPLWNYLGPRLWNNNGHIDFELRSQLKREFNNYDQT